jgi:hypothetical protein
MKVLRKKEYFYVFFMGSYTLFKFTDSEQLIQKESEGRSQKKEESSILNQIS